MKKEDGQYCWKPGIIVRVVGGRVVGGEYRELGGRLALHVYNAETDELASDGVPVCNFLSCEYKLY